MSLTRQSGLRRIKRQQFVVETWNMLSLDGFWANVNTFFKFQKIETKTDLLSVQFFKGSTKRIHTGQTAPIRHL
jgi:hypothetical protein